jgi:hypothetical protein
MTMHANPPDRLNLRVWLILALAGAVLAVIGWYRYFQTLS